jgi:hypothetical protein
MIVLRSIREIKNDTGDTLSKPGEIDDQLGIRPAWVASVNHGCEGKVTVQLFDDAGRLIKTVENYHR